MGKACYNCRHYSLQMEGNNGKKQKQIERCAAKNGAQLEVAAVVDGTPIGLVSFAQYAKLAENKRVVFSFGSPARYMDATGRFQECPLYERKHREARIAE